MGLSCCFIFLLKIVRLIFFTFHNGTKYKILLFFMVVAVAKNVINFIGAVVLKVTLFGRGRVQGHETGGYDIVKSWHGLVAL